MKALRYRQTLVKDWVVDFDCEVTIFSEGGRRVSRWASDNAISYLPRVRANSGGYAVFKDETDAMACYLAFR